MTKFTEQLWRDLAQEHGPALAGAARAPGRNRRPHLIAGSTLTLAGAGLALGLGLTATGSTPAWAVTRSADGTVVVQIGRTSSLPQANAKLTAMGIREQVEVALATGPAPARGPVDCRPAPGASHLPGPALRVLLGQDGTQVTSAGSTGAGTWHVGVCYVSRTGTPGPAITSGVVATPTSG